jgi:signal transduction histidine kinase
MRASELHNYRILVVDDEKNLREVVSQMVRYAGFDCVAAQNGDGALDILQNVPVDVMVTDIVMPGMDGIELTLRTKKEFNVGVIVMTGYAKDYSFEQIIEKGADDFIEKPIRANELIIRLKRLIREREILDERNCAEAMLRDSENQLRALAVRLQEVEEEMRKEIARELHDRMGQNLTALNLNLNIIKNYLSDESLKKTEPILSDSMKLVVEATEHVRDVMAMLRPVGLDDYGLVSAMRWYGKCFSARTGIPVYVVADENYERLPVSMETELFRIAQEAFNNILKHAHANRVEVSYTRNKERIRFVIADNGEGFDPGAVSDGSEKIGWGLLLMKERARAVQGKLFVDSRPGKGTAVEVEVRPAPEQESKSVLF